MKKTQTNDILCLRKKIYLKNDKNSDRLSLYEGQARTWEALVLYIIANRARQNMHTDCD